MQFVLVPVKVQSPRTLVLQYLPQQVPLRTPTPLVKHNYVVMPRPMGCQEFVDMIINWLVLFDI